MEKIFKIADIARKAVELLVDNTEAEIVAALWNEKTRKGIAADLKGIAEWCEDAVIAYKASVLWREVMAL